MKFHKILKTYPKIILAHPHNKEPDINIGLAPNLLIWKNNKKWQLCFVFADITEC